VAIAERFRAHLLAEEGEEKRAEVAFAAAADGFRDRGVVFWLGVTLLNHGEWLISVGRSDDASPLLAEAREIFARLRALPWLARLDAATAPHAAAAFGSRSASGSA
jgi:hypothetical protein